MSELVLEEVVIEESPGKFIKLYMPSAEAERAIIGEEKWDSTDFLLSWLIEYIANSGQISNFN